MFNWFNRPRELINRSGLAAHWVQHFYGVFLSKAAETASLAADIMSYLVEDGSDAILGRLRALPDTSKLVAPGSDQTIVLANKELPWTEFFADVRGQDWGFYERLGRVFDALVPAAHHIPDSVRFVGPLRWVWLLLTGMLPSDYFTKWPKKTTTVFPFTAMEGILRHDDLDPSLLIEEAFFPFKLPYHDYDCPLVLQLRGVEAGFGRYPEVVRRALTDKNIEVRLYALALLARPGVTLVSWIKDLAALAVSGSKRVRSAVVSLPVKRYTEFREALDAAAARGPVDDRVQAVQALALVYGRDALPFLEALQKTTPPEKVAAALEMQLSTLKGVSPEQSPLPEALELPDLPPLPVTQKLDASTEQAIRGKVAAYNDVVRRDYEASKNQNYWKGRTVETWGPEVVTKLLARIEDLVISQAQQPAATVSWHAREKLLHIVTIPELTLLQAVRAIILINGWNPSPNRGAHEGFPALQEAVNLHWKNHSGSLRELGRVLKTVGLDANIPALRALSTRHSYYDYGNVKLPPAGVWPYYAERLDLLAECLGIRPYRVLPAPQAWENFALNGLLVLANFPTPPAMFIPILWQKALEGNKEERKAAQRSLEKVPGYLERVAEALKDGSQEVRIRAADWLAEAKDPQSIPALKKALAKEKQERVKAAIMASLEACGAPVAEFLDVDNLGEDAKKALAKGSPSKLEWLPRNLLPPVRWAESKKPLDPAVLEWFIVRSFQLKSPEPDPALRIYSSFFDKGDAAALGLFVLKAWMAQDTQPKYDHDQALVEARRSTDQMRRWMASDPKWDEPAFLKSQHRHFMDECMGSAIEFKGLLALTAAGGGMDAVKPAYEYIKKWYGGRAAQAKALLQTLAWIEHPMAAQVLLSVGRRFRTRSIQEEATRLIKEMAERKGWTMDELADRTVSTAGLDDTARLELDFGSRSFVAQLGADFKLELAKEDGTPLKSLPEPNKADDAALAAEAKKMLSDAGKEIKQLVPLQKERLYDAFCLQRVWKAADWQEYLNGHPIVGVLCQRLVWVAVKAGVTVASFRPLGDRTLSDNQDSPITLEEGWEVRVAHDTTLSAENIKLWKNHFKDYAVEPLFVQFEKGSWSLPPEKQNETVITDFEGYLLESFKLRTLMTKAGYTRGSAEDGGWFTTYFKSFPSIGLTATLGFSGNSLPEESRTVALIDLTFRQKTGEGDEHSQLTLGEIPPILLRECRFDLETAARAGTGHDADWAKKVYN